MSTGTVTARLTAEEFAAMPDTRGMELVDGEPLELPMSVASSETGGEVFARLWQYSKDFRLGSAFPADTGLRCFPDDPHRVRKPDACFVRQERLDVTARQGAFLPVAPDLVVEVVSPTDLATELEAKEEEYLAAGVLLVWVVDPINRTARVRRFDGTAAVVRESGTLDGESVLPGFGCPLADVLPNPPLPRPKP